MLTTTVAAAVSTRQGSQTSTPQVLGLTLGSFSKAQNNASDLKSALTSVIPAEQV